MQPLVEEISININSFLKKSFYPIIMKKIFSDQAGPISVEAYTASGGVSIYLFPTKPVEALSKPIINRMLAVLEPIGDKFKDSHLIDEETLWVAEIEAPTAQRKKELTAEVTDFLTALIPQINAQMVEKKDCPLHVKRLEERRRRRPTDICQPQPPSCKTHF